MNDPQHFEVIVIGGSYAGLSAAMALGRSLRKVLIIDSGVPCNRQTPHSHNFLTRDGVKPGVMAAIGKNEVLQYKTVQLTDDVAIGVEKINQGFTVRTKSGNVYHSKKLVLATGIRDTMPDIKGFADCWGISVVHCPYCHGYEIRNYKTLIMADAERAFHLAPLVSNLTKNLSIVTTSKSDFSVDQLTRLAAHKIEVMTQDIIELEHKDGYLQQVVLDDGRKVPFQSIYAALPFTQHSDIPVALGCELTEHGYIRVDHFQKTTVDGVYACGDNSNRMRAVANAVYTGNLTGAMINMELADEHW